MQEARSKVQAAGRKVQRASRSPVLTIALLVVVWSSLLVFGIAAAQGGHVTDDQVNAVAKKLNCPVCENVPLDVCETQACSQWRDLIRQKLGAGETPQQIINYFQATYGDRVLQEPPRQGFTGLVWILPVVGLIGGMAILVVVLRRMTVRPAAVQVETPGVSESADEYRQRLERELEELR
jgi:cytochrome c-type biogenesis protein CcmH